MTQNRNTTRSHRRRRGSVLILVVALIVLLALIGTGLIVTARSDVYAARQNSYNTQVDMLIDGVMNVSEQKLVDAISVPNATGTAVQFRPLTYTHYVHPQVNTFLASRVPENNGGAYWQYISASPLASSGAFQFEAPNTTGGYNSRTNVRPTSVNLTLPDGTQKAFPALSTAEGTFLAGDADGDGIADGGLFRLPIGQMNGITYYSTIRIIDNNAAVNASVAMKWNDGTDAGGLKPAGWMPGDFFPTNVNLQGLFIGPNDYLQWTQVRTNGAFNGATFTATPYDDNGAARSDFSYASPYDMIWHGLGTRVRNPGRTGAAASQQFKPMSAGETMALAHHFTLAPQGSQPTYFELYTRASTLDPMGTAGKPAVNKEPYQANEVATWFNSIFNYNTNGVMNMPSRALLVGRNGMSNFTPARFTNKTTGGAGLYQLGDWVKASNGRSYVCIQTTTSGPPGTVQQWAPVPWTSHPTRASVNTAEFGELAAAYWAVMADAPGATGAGTVQFKNPMRFGGPLTGPQMLQLRAALAAVNTMDLRDADKDVTSRTITITAGNAAPQFKVNIYGSEMQPYLTEVFVHGHVDPNKPLVYRAVEIHNPHPVAIDLTAFRLCAFNHGGQPYALREIAKLGPLHGSLPPGGHLVLENDPQGRPADLEALWSARPPAIPPVRCTDLDKLQQGGATAELLLMRTRRYDGTTTSATNPENEFDESKLEDLVMCDQVDMRGVEAPAFDPTDPAKSLEVRYRYARGTMGVADPNQSAAWHCVWPGKLVPTVIQGRPLQMEGWKYEQSNDPNTPIQPPGAPNGPAYPALGYPKGKMGSGPEAATYQTRAIQVANGGAAGPNESAAAPRKYPFGQFARAGDILTVTFTGGYRVQAATAAGALELNGVGFDSTYAEDGDGGNDAPGGENVGRFTPTDDEAKNRVDTGYGWARDLFEYLCTFSPQNDFAPDADPQQAGRQAIANGPVTNAAQANAGNEDTASIEGLININTAPWRVLAALPMIPTDPAANATLAQEIVKHRDANGPFQSIFELQNVNGFKTANGTVNVVGLDADDAHGDLTPSGAGTDQVYGDFETQYLVLNRISNLITTRSDSFTVYVLVQGWRNAGTSTPELVVQRRAAFIADRAAVKPISTTTTAAGTDTALSPVQRMNVPQ